MIVTAPGSPTNSALQLAPSTIGGPGFPQSAKKKIAKLMQASITRSQGIELSFTDAEFDDILLAMKLTGYTRRREFYHDAIVEKAASVNAAEKRIIPSGIERVDNQENRVAEDPPKLG